MKRRTGVSPRHWVQRFPTRRRWFGIKNWPRELGIPEATPAKFGGSNWATGGATTGNGYEVGPVVNLTNYPYGYPNLGQQVSDYVSTTAAGPSNALFAVWAGE